MRKDESAESHRVKREGTSEGESPLEHLWAPWRSSYVGEKREDREKHCIFCVYPAEGEASFRKNLILYSDPHAFVILNRFPYNGGHVMVVPRLHVATLEELPEEPYLVLCKMIRATCAALRSRLRLDGLNLGMNLGASAGAGIAQHCHFHIVPRWNGDTNFMPVVSGTKVISRALDETYDFLLPAFTW